MSTVSLSLARARLDSSITLECSSALSTEARDWAWADGLPDATTKRHDVAIWRALLAGARIVWQSDAMRAPVGYAFEVRPSRSPGLRTGRPSLPRSSTAGAGFRCRTG